MEDFVRVLTIENEIEADRLTKILDEKGIPYQLKSYHDSALDGLYQFQMGWGYLAAPQEYSGKIREIYDDLSS